MVSLNSAWARMRWMGQTDLSNLDSVTVYRLHRCHEGGHDFVEDVQGGGLLENQLVSVRWACSGEEFCQVSLQEKFVLAEVRSIVAASLNHSMYCMQVMKGYRLFSCPKYMNLGQTF